MLTTLEQRVNEQFALDPIDLEIDRPVVLSSSAGPATATPVVVAVVAVRLVAVEVLTMIARRYNPF
jgi:hypothetical protein